MRPIWIRASTANLWASPEGCLPSCTFQPADKGSQETEHTLRGTRLHSAVASIIAPADNPRPALKPGEWPLAQSAVAALEAHVAVDAYDRRVEHTIGRHMGLSHDTHVWMSSTPDLVLRARKDGWRGSSIPRGDPKLIIADWKFGRYNVEAEGNRQLAAYAVLLLFGEDKWAHDLDWKDDDIIRTMIIQPAAAEVGEPMVRRSTLTYGQVKKGADYLDYIVDRVSDPDYELPYNPTADNCRYCRGAETMECPAVAKGLVEVEEKVVEFGLVPPSEYANVLAKTELVAEWAKHIRLDAQRRLERGEPVQGLKLVPGRAGNRRWIDPDATAKALRSKGDHPPKVEIFTEPVLKSPAQMEKAFKGINAPISEGIIGTGWERPPAQNTVAYESDPRPALDKTGLGKALEVFKAKQEDSNG